jgi:hypothetical protein
MMAAFQCVKSKVATPQGLHPPKVILDKVAPKKVIAAHLFCRICRDLLTLNRLTRSTR